MYSFVPEVWVAVESRIRRENSHLFGSRFTLWLTALNLICAIGEKNIQRCQGEYVCARFQQSHVLVMQVWTIFNLKLL